MIFVLGDLSKKQEYVEQEYDTHHKFLSVSID